MDAREIITAYKRLRKPIGTIKSVVDAQLYAEETAGVLAKIIGNPGEGMTVDELADIMVTALKAANGDIAQAAQIALKKANKAAGVGLSPLVPDINTDGMIETAAKILDGEIGEGIKTALEDYAIKSVDNAVKENAEAHEDLGLYVHIVRKYSDVGLRSGTKYAEPCQWCLDRCGDWNNYQEAYQAGCFERHPGCKCEIDYHVGKTHDIYRGFDKIG